MKDYSANITDHLGATYEFKISINEKKRIGRMTYLNEEYILSRCSKYAGTDGLYFLMHIGQYIKINMPLKSICDEQQNVFELILGLTQYTLSAKSCDDFHAYVDKLDLPLADTRNVDVSKDQKWEEDILFAELKPQVSLYIGWFPFDSGPFARFVNITVNNSDVDLSNSYQISNGTVVPMGNFDANQPYVIAWKCETSYTPFGAKTAVGYFINNDLNTRKILRVKEVDHFEEWTDSETISLNSDK
ncbi:MAG: hypothetical protein K0S23_741 [Fluviicola sp.]|jgi:hypothetical protein|uniref:hypothetical protein n=1 Tax=Fluviicola sp. TaxID=1917219 RepID=UPI0026100A57|nr:hypothetical protein [Fluviicola sp.]MDF3026434.1 hypothetical protein [Fluviicola sp.]